MTLRVHNERMETDISRVRVVLAEDIDSDAELVERLLQRAGLVRSIYRVKTLAGFREALEHEVDIVLCDHSLGNCTGRDVLDALLASGRDIPFIVVTATLGDEAAAEYIKLGASDYILKDRMAKLPSAIAQALREQKQRRETLRLQQEADQAARQLKESEERYRMLFQSNPQPLYVYELPTLQILAVNDAAVVHYGFSAEEFLGMTIKELRPPEEVPKLLATIGKSGYKLSRVGVWKHWKKDGTLIDVEIIIHNLKFDGKDAVLALVIDVTDRRALEAQVRQSQKMEAVGRLAGGVAHDFNNLMMVVTSYAQLLLDKEPIAPMRRYAEQILEAGRKAAAVTGQLLAFSRKQVLQPSVLDLNQLISHFSKMLPRFLREDIELVLDLAPGIGPVVADRGQIEQVIMNLVINARDAMPNGGKVIIETRNVYLDEEYCRRHQVGLVGAYVLIAISDTGMGMNAETQNRIFEPFFTTKESGQGTGLGLATVYGIVKQSNGYIWVYSELDRGSTFKVYLPRCDKGREEQANELQTPHSAPSGTETILLVEDSPELRAAAREFLESKGYTVLECGNGLDAVRVAREPESVIHVILTDMVMPGLGAIETVTEVRKHHPSIGVIYMSGYTDRVIGNEVFAHNAVFLQKPFSLETLAHKLAEILGKTGQKD